MASNIGPYAPPAGSSLDPGLGSFYLNQLPEAGFWHYLSQMGLTGNDPTARYAQQQQARTYAQYLGQANNNPNQGFFDYLQESSPNYAADYAAQSPTQRFDFSSQNLAPRARWTFK